MKQTDRIILEGLRKSVLADLPQLDWDMVVKAVVDAGDVRDVQGMAQTILFDAIEKASFASRSEAGRYAANMRWRGSVPKGGVAANEARMAERARQGLGSGNPARRGKDADLNQVYMRWLDHEAPQTSGKDLVRMLDAKIVTHDQLNEFDRNLVAQERAKSGAKTGEFMDLTDINPSGSMDKPAGEDKQSPAPDIDEATSTKIKQSDLSGLARMIDRDFRSQGKSVPYNAKPYVDALRTLEHVGQDYYFDSGESIVAYTLSNLSGWKGPVARAVKAELKARLKAGPLLKMSDEQALPPVIEAWVKQLLDPSFVELMRSQPYDRVDVRMSASKGRVSRLPQIVLNGGQQEFIDAI